MNSWNHFSYAILYCHKFKQVSAKKGLDLNLSF